MPNAPRIFVSYSSPDQVKADAIRAALEAEGVSCWIAPRDLSAGTQWGAGIVQAIHGCEAVVVVFSDAANRSPQVAREMELAVSSRRPLIPIRVADAMPTEDMQYFLGVSHWFNAYAQPIDRYLPDIVTSVKSVLAHQRTPWASLRRRLPNNNIGRAALFVGLMGGVLALSSILWRPSASYTAPRSPLSGRWQTKMPKADGAFADCELDVPSGGLARFSDDCPEPIAGASGPLSASKDAMFAPGLFKSGDTGTFMFQNSSGGMFTGAYRRGWFHLQTRDDRFGTLTWRSISSSKPLASETPAIVTAGVPWPTTGVPQMAQKAITYVRGKWHSDAVLMKLDLKPGTTGGVQPSFTFYSPNEQQVTFYQPGGMGSQFAGVASRQDNVKEAIGTTFVDLPDAIERAHAAGMQGKQITEATLSWTGGDACGTGNFRIDNAILPRCRPGRFIGLQWTITSALGERLFVPAA